MLNFDINHSYVEGNINEKKGKKKISNIIIAGLIVTNLLTFSGCSKNVSCDISGEHAHYYINDNYLGRYIVSEKSSVSGLDRLDIYVSVGNEDADLLEFINKKDLFKISDNQKAIENITAEHQDYKEYRYFYYYLLPMPHTYTDGKKTYTTYNYIPMIGYYWTSDQNKENLTGEERVCHYVYYGYKIEKDKTGGYELIKSEPVDDLRDLPEEYAYIKEKFYDVVNFYDRNEVLDYEDGPEEEKEIINEDEYQAKVKSR